MELNVRSVRRTPVMCACVCVCVCGGKLDLCVPTNLLGPVMCKKSVICINY
jgi:hypothetical protein